MYQKKQSNFKGLTLKVFKNKYKNKPTSYDYKGDGDEFFLKKLGAWLKSPEIKSERDNGKPLKVGVRMTSYQDKESCEITFYIGQPKQQNSYNGSDDLMDDTLPNNEGIPF